MRFAPSQQGSPPLRSSPGRTGGEAVVPWCLWCLFEAEIGAIHAEQLKTVAECETVEIANIDAVFHACC